MNTGTYLNACKVPWESKVEVCALWVKAGPPYGVTVKITPPNATQQACVEAKVRTFEALGDGPFFSRGNFEPAPTPSALKLPH
ncbi:MAG: hypothetical protein U0271_30360 [Polyangiaceae bacterium]